MSAKTVDWTSKPPTRPIDSLGRLRQDIFKIPKSATLLRAKFIALKLTSYLAS